MAQAIKHFALVAVEGKVRLKKNFASGVEQKTLNFCGKEGGRGQKIGDCLEANRKEGKDAPGHHSGVDTLQRTGGGKTNFGENITKENQGARLHVRVKGGGTHLQRGWEPGIPGKIVRRMNASGRCPWHLGVIWQNTEKKKKK